MKNRYSYILSASLLLGTMLLTQSCSTIFPESIVKTNNKGSETGSNNKKKSHRDVLPKDRQQFIIDKSAKTYTPEDLQKGVIKGDWSIIEINGRQPIGEEAPYIKFDITTNKVYAYNGCNYLNGSYTCIPAQKTMTFDENMISTMRECQSDTGLTDIQINAALAAVRTYSWELKDPQFFLYLYDEHGTRVLTLMHQSFEFLNGTWLIKAIDDQPVNLPDMRFVIDVSNNKVFGNTGCNLINGKLLTEMDAPNSISFQALTITMKSCPEQEYENDLIVALEDASTAKPISPDKVMLYNNHSVPVLELERAK